MIRRLLGLIAFVSTGVGLLVLSAQGGELLRTLGMLLIGFCFSVGVWGHYKELMK